MGRGSYLNGFVEDHRFADLDAGHCLAGLLHGLECQPARGLPVGVVLGGRNGEALVHHHRLVPAHPHVSNYKLHNTTHTTHDTTTKQKEPTPLKEVAVLHAVRETRAPDRNGLEHAGVAQLTQHVGTGEGLRHDCFS